MRTYLSILVSVAALQVACDIETTPQVDAGGVGAAGDAGADAGPPVIERRFVQEPYAIGASWYAYDSQTHSVNPRPVVYRAERGQQAWAFDIESYYNREGESGYFRIRISEYVDGQWSEPSLFEAVESAKEGPVCIDLDARATTDCDSQDSDLVLRTDLRVVPAAGFAVQNPAIYAASHYSDPSPVRLSRQQAEDIESVDTQWTPLPDSAVEPSTAMLSSYRPIEPGEASPLFLQATAAFELALWRMRATADGLAIDATCVELATEPGAQIPLSTDDLQSTQIAWPDDGGVLVSLCGSEGPSEVSSYGEAHRGGWPATDTFALFIEQYRDEKATRVAPGHLIWTSGDTGFEGVVSVPETLWD